MSEWLVLLSVGFFCPGFFFFLLGICATADGQIHDYYIWWAGGICWIISIILLLIAWGLK